MNKKVFIFGILYLTAGLEGAIITVLLPILLSNMKFTATITGLAISIAMAPWVLEFIWGKLIDKNSNKGKRIFVIIGGLIGIVSNLVLYILNEDNIFSIITLIFASEIGITLLITSSNAWAIQISNKKERGHITSAEIVGQVIGFSIGAMYFTRIYRLNLKLPFLVTALSILLIIPIAMLVKDIKKKPKTRIKLKNIQKSIVEIAIIILPLGVVGITAYFMKSYLHMDDSMIGLVMMLSSVFNAIGALFGGTLSDKYGRKAVTVVSIIGFCLSTLPTIIYFVPSFLMISFFSGSLISAFCAWCMDKTKKGEEATEYSIFTSTANFGNILGTTVGGLMLSYFGTLLFVVIGGISIVSLFTVYFFSKTS